MEDCERRAIYCKNSERALYAQRREIAREISAACRKSAGFATRDLDASPSAT